MQSLNSYPLIPLVLFILDIVNTYINFDMYKLVNVSTKTMGMWPVEIDDWWK